MRMIVEGLSPNIKYNLQLRASDGASVSAWSRTFSVIAASDTLAPAVPQSFDAVTSGTSFIASWNAVTTNADTSPLYDLAYYRITIVNNANQQSVQYRVIDTKYEFTIALNRAAFGLPAPDLTISVAAVDTSGNASGASTP